MCDLQADGLFLNSESISLVGELDTNLPCILSQCFQADFLEKL